MSRFVLCAAACAASFWLSATGCAHPVYASPAAVYQYRHTTYHRQVTALEQQIRLRKAEIAALERRIEAWEPLDRFREGRPLMVSIENAKLLLLAACLDLASLEQELFDLVRSRGYQ